MKKILFVLVIFAVAMSMVACGKSESLVGNWTLWSKGYIEFFGTINEFKEDGTVINYEDDFSGKWSTAGKDKFNVELDGGDVFVFTYVFNEGKLVITDEEGNVAILQRPN